jgi:hypothetical protein
MFTLNARIAFIVFVGCMVGCNKPTPPENNVATPVGHIVESAYERGQEAGREAALRQFGVPITEAPVKIYSYTTTNGAHENGEEKEEESRGYVDGYHRALDTIYCPASSMTR